MSERLNLDLPEGLNLDLLDGKMNRMDREGQDLGWMGRMLGYAMQLAIF
ncbi:MAG: hypothetical protein AVDCRST_MAG56-5458 [uncultured Cytophagales bacterium]|uniref:Uncharacterized protein n=1 Tax=uncultured Cytophagales bacterium TaxID=158755 RepID=A0A6J4KCV6_9SPHI|nr:MAG: hypothetical protein AVDCRST_MAG56-5458 [uncultured Cytophagales bacterium]